MENEEAAGKIAVALHPPRCPKCGKEIKYLVNICDRWVEYEFEIGDDGFGDYAEKDSWSGDYSEFKCPACQAHLFDNEEDAEQFLKGEEE